MIIICCPKDSEPGFDDRKGPLAKKLGGPFNSFRAFCPVRFIQILKYILLITFRL
jgi:hypothetical protein